MKAYRIVRLWLAIRFPKLRKCLLSDKENEKLIMAEFRALALFFGFDISEMSDQEINDGVNRAAKEMSKLGLSAAEAVQAVEALKGCVFWGSELNLHNFQNGNNLNKKHK